MAKILIVDDSPTQLIMYKMAIKKAGYDVITAENGIEGINTAYNQMPDLIVSDIIMPEINGYVLCRLLKNDPVNAHIPVILLSSLGQQHDRFWGLEAGADAYLVKEADTSKLTETIADLLEKIPNGAGAAAKVLKKGDETDNISGKIYKILDNLLFEHTVSNKIRDIFKYAYNSVQLLQNYFEFLNSLVDYSMAGIALKTDFENFLTFDVQHQVPKRVLQRVMEKNLKGEDSKKYDLEIFNRKNIMGDEKSVNMASEIVEPIIFNNEWRGFISIHSTKSSFFDEQTEKIMKISALELTNLIQFITKMKEIDSLKAEFASMVVYDLNKPLTESVEMLQALLSGKVGELNDEQKEALKTSLTQISQAMDISESISTSVHKIYSDKL